MDLDVLREELINDRDAELLRAIAYDKAGDYLSARYHAGLADGTNKMIGIIPILKGDNTDGL